MKTMNDIGKKVADHWNRLWENHECAALAIGAAISVSGIFYGIYELKEHYLHPRFCQEYGWLADEPREVQVAYANELCRVGQDSWRDIQPYLKEYSAHCFLEELDQCRREQEEK